MVEYRSPLRRALERAGWISRPSERTVLFFGVDEASRETVEAVIVALGRRYGRLLVSFVARDPAGPAPPAREWPDHLALPPPWGNPLSALLFLLTSRARLVIALGSLRHLDRGFARRAYYLGIPIVVLDAVARASEPASGRHDDPWLLARVDLFLPRDAVAATELRLRRVPAERIHPPETALDAGGRGQRIVEALAPLIGRRPPVRRPLQQSVLSALDNPRLRRIVGLRVQRIDSLEAFRGALGDPGTILCLGNGPSSENPAIGSLAHDRLFRVNHRWQARCFLTKPDVVFTGQKRTLFTLKAPIFAFQTLRSEAHLVTHQIFNPFCRRMRYVTLERLGILPAIDEGGLRPSNGAAMLAAAVALQPAKLIVAGIDLFQHPDGSYPGDSQTPNAYVPAHDRELELKFILRILGEFRGELVVVGEVLAGHVARHRPIDTVKA